MAIYLGVDSDFAKADASNCTQRSADYLVDSDSGLTLRAILRKKVGASSQRTVMRSFRSMLAKITQIKTG